MTNKQKMTKLCNIRTDLRDDSGHINTINKKIQSVADDFLDLFKSIPNGSTIKTKIEDLKEPSQDNDYNLKQARHYCQQEINKVDAAIKAEENS